MRTGKDALQKMHEETSVEDVLDLMDAIQEQNQIEQEISDILAGVPSTLSVADEAAVERELEALMMAGEPVASTVDTLPEVPTTLPLPVAPSGNVGEPDVAIHDKPRLALHS